MVTAEADEQKPATQADFDTVWVAPSSSVESSWSCSIVPLDFVAIVEKCKGRVLSEKLWRDVHLVEWRVNWYLFVYFKF